MLSLVVVHACCYPGDASACDGTAKDFLPVSVLTNHSFGEEVTLEYQLSEHRIRGWRAVSAAGLQGKGWRKRSVFLHRHRYLSRQGF